MAHPQPPHLNTPTPISTIIEAHSIAWPARAPSYESLVEHLARISNAVSPAGEWARAIEEGFTAADCARRSANQRKPQTATVLLGIVDMLMLQQRSGHDLSDSVLFHLGGPNISERTASRYGTTRRAWLARHEAWA
ncbi:hypothetical protein JCM9279_004334 [Rhodotorula babjevae]